jgi:site-specific recombinase XerD
LAPHTRAAVGARQPGADGGGAALKVFFGFLVENECLERDPTLVLRTPKKLLDVLDGRALSLMLEATQRDGSFLPPEAERRQRWAARHGGAQGPLPLPG